MLRLAFFMQRTPSLNAKKDGDHVNHRDNLEQEINHSKLIVDMFHLKKILLWNESVILYLQYGALATVGVMVAAAPTYFEQTDFALTDFEEI